LRGTVERNLRYRDPEVSAGQLAGVLRLTGLDRVLERLPEGADTRLRDRGRPLSSGERARLALARALVGHPRVLLLDEVEANLDGAGADAVLRVVESLRGEVTILLVTHRPELAARADTVWHMERGCLSMAASAPRSW
jgi:ABC-type transport system involved in cytochrome bd biosynthesis fused ATPase/permease subunit